MEPAPDRRAEVREHTHPASLDVSAEAPAGPLSAARAGFRGLLPPRYATDSWDRRFRAEIDAALADGADILDVGAGAHPVLAPEERPPGCTYVGLDVSAQELAKAPAGSYDRTVVADAADPQAALDGGFDLVLSFMALEHVESLPRTLASLRGYLRPGGRLIAQMPGAFSLAAVANRVVPAPLKRRLLHHAQHRAAETIFPAHYDHCWHAALERLLANGWERPRVVPLYTGVFYTAFSPPLRAIYLAYEELAYRRGWRNLAPYYLVTASGPGGARR